MTLRIGIVGGYQVGKTTLGNYLGTQHGFSHFQLAAPLKLITASLYPEKASTIYASNKSKEARDLLNKVSLNYKTRFGKDCYAKLVTTTMYSDRDVVVSDVRFMEEAHHLLDNGFVLIALGTEFEGYDIKEIKEALCKLQLPAKPPNDFTNLCIGHLRENYDV